MTQITWLGHATFELRFDSGEVLVFDPWTTGNPKYPKSHSFSRIDAIAISHGHSDHMGDAVPLAREFNPKTVAIFEVASWLEKQGVKNTIGINKGGTVDLGFVKLTMTQAIHSSAIKDGDDLVYGGEAASYVLTEKSGRRAYFAGDTCIFSDMKLIGDLYKPELAFLPVGDYYTMGPYEAAHAARMLNPKKVIPMHYGTFPVLTGTPEELAANLKSDGIQIWKLKQGEAENW